MNKISIIGAGTMGNGIAHVFSLAGYKVIISDVNKDLLGKALETINNNLERQVKKELIDQAQKEKTLQNIQSNTNLEESVAEADLIIEAIPENMELKSDLFRKLDNMVPSGAIFATNTSSISITALASVTDRQDRVIGMHFMNPVPVMKLVEIIRGYNTSEETVRNIYDLAKKIGKTPVEVNDYPGFISNRILMPMINEAIYSLYQGVAGVEEIDTVMKLGMAHPMGPLQLADFIGLDVCLSILNVLQEGFGEQKYAPCPLLINMVQAGHLGVKSGQGFYDWRKGKNELSVSERFKK